MKKKIYLIVFNVTTLFAFSQTQYQQGFNEGFRNGYCHGIVAGCVSPIAPPAPVSITMNYQTGYNNGFLAGKNKKDKQNNADSSYLGGAYGQLQPLKPLDMTPLNNLNNSVNELITNYDWQAYYERRTLAKQEKERLKNEYTQNFYEENRTVNQWINELQEKLESQNVDINKINGIIFNFKNQNEKLFQKYFNKRSKYKNYLFEMNKLKNEILDFTIK